MNIIENLKCNKIINKAINKHFSAQKHLQTTIVASFYIISDTITKLSTKLILRHSSLILVVRYVNYLIPLFMNKNESFRNER